MGRRTITAEILDVSGEDDPRYHTLVLRVLEGHGEEADVVRGRLISRKAVDVRRQA